MAKVKLTKTELKAQKDALARFRRFLPMLQLKKQQLQLEIATMRGRVEETARQRDALLNGAASWIGLLADESAEIPVVLERVKLGQGNIAGVVIPVYEGIETRRPETDLFATPAWVDEAAEAAARLMEAAAKIDVQGRGYAATKVTVADTVGAGDTFNAGVLAALHEAGALTKAGVAALSDAVLDAALSLGTRAAAITVSRAGANPPWSHEL